MNDIIDKDQIKDAKDLLKTRFHDFIINYINDTRSIFSEMDIAHATGQINHFKSCLHQLKSSSFQAAALRVFQQIQLMEKFIHDHYDDMATIPFQTRLENQFQELRRQFSKYCDAIETHL